MKQHKIVYRVAGLSVGRGLAGVRFHGERTGGDLEHVTPPEQYAEQGRTAPVVFQYDEQGKRIPGAEAKGRDWVAALRDEVKQAAAENTAAQVANLEARGKKYDATRRAKEGDKSPYRKQKGGPLREFVIAANAEWFQDEDGRPGKWDAERVRAFVKEGVKFAEKEWGTALRYVRVDFDEGAPHIHGVAAPWAEVKTRTGAVQRMLAATKHAASVFEKAQDRAGEWFERIGLVRGKKTAQARREARQEGKPVPPKAKHTPPAVWRREKAAELAEREAALSKREEKADAVLALAPHVHAAAVEQRDQRAAVEAAQAEQARREEEKRAAMEEAKRAKKARDGEERRRAAIAKAAREKAIRAKIAKAKAKASRKDGAR